MHSINSCINSMKIVFACLLFCLFTQGLLAQTEDRRYNKALADSLGADEYGMKMYILVLLKTGSNQTKDKAAIGKLFAGHMENINKLAANGKLVVAGPMEKNDKFYRGIFILNVKTAEEAGLLLKTDPAIAAKLLDAELYPWYGSAALPMYLKYHDIVELKKP